MAAAAAAAAVVAAAVARATRPEPAASRRWLNRLVKVDDDALGPRFRARHIARFLIVD